MGQRAMRGRGGHSSSGLLRGPGLILPSQEAMWTAETLGMQLEGGRGPDSTVPVPSSE